MPRYSAEFKKEALRLLEKSGRSLNAVSRELGISNKTLTQWKEEAELGERLKDRDFKEEVRRLQRENARLILESPSAIYCPAFEGIFLVCDGRGGEICRCLIFRGRGQAGANKEISPPLLFT
ncbi:MAG TPA: transposase [Acidobacteriota bacterium]|nr:transposase [Acidobacteriota bacterium]